MTTQEFLALPNCREAIEEMQISSILRIGGSAVSRISTTVWLVTNLATGSELLIKSGADVCLKLYQLELLEQIEE